MRSMFSNITTYERMKNKFLNKSNITESDMGSIESDLESNNKLEKNLVST